MSSARNTVALILALATLARFLLVQWKKLPRVVSGVYVVGGSGKRNILKNRQKFQHHSRDLILEGYRHSAGNGFYYVPTAAGERLIIPTRFTEELKSASLDKVDFIGIVRELMEGDYTGIGNRTRLHPDTLKSHLTPRVASIMPDVQAEIHEAVQDIFPLCEDWTEIPIFRAMTQIVTRATSRMMGGPQLSRDAEWTEAAISFAHHALRGALKIKALPWLIRPIVAPFIPEIRRDIPNCFRTAEKAAVPILRQREEDGEKANDFLSFLKDVAKGKENDNKFISKVMLLTAFASVHTSSAAPCQLIFDLCAHPEYFDMLRQEYSSLLDEKGSITKGAFSRMVKMDSCMKESQRFWPATLLTFERIVKVDWTLSNGFQIPAGTRIGVPNYAVSMDPNIFPEPERFDGLRFEKLRKSDPSMEGKAQFVSCNPTSLNFGYGRHACPGRAFFADEFKAIMGLLIETYDMKFKDGQSRPGAIQFDSQYIIEPSTTILFKKRKAKGEQ